MVKPGKAAGFPGITDKMLKAFSEVSLVLPLAVFSYGGIP